MSSRLKIPPELKNVALISLGLLFCTLAYDMYLIPNNIAAGGFTGIGQLVNALCGVNVGTVSLLLNLPLFLLSIRSLGLHFGLRSVIAMTALNLLIDHAGVMPATDDMMLATIYGAVLGGIGFGLILRGNATTGGTDMLASLIHKQIPVFRVSYCIFATDGLVIFASAFVFDQQAAMYAIICAFLMNLMVDIVLEGPNGARSFFIISDHADEISNQLMAQLERGVTALDGMGMYSRTRKKVLLCVVNRFETMQLRRIVFGIDPKAFVIANNAHEVLGEGFREN